MLIVLKAIATSIAVLGGLGLALGLILALASKVLAVAEDPRKKRLMKLMPGADCGACGFSGCSAYADAVIEGATVVGVCPVGGTALAEKMASVMGVTDVGANLRQVALVRCDGSDYSRSDDESVRDCQAAMEADGSPAHRNSCLALGSCVTACDFDAIHLTNGVARVDAEKCAGCLKCVRACPRGLITVVPYAPPRSRFSGK